MEDEKFKIGDFVLIKDPKSDEKLIGKIEEILIEDGEKLIRFNEYYFPNKTTSKKF